MKYIITKGKDRFGKDSIFIEDLEKEDDLGLPKVLFQTDSDSDAVVKIAQLLGEEI